MKITIPFEGDETTGFQNLEPIYLNTMYKHVHRFLNRNMQGAIPVFPYVSFILFPYVYRGHRCVVVGLLTPDTAVVYLADELNSAIDEVGYKGKLLKIPNVGTNDSSLWSLFRNQIEHAMMLGMVESRLR